MSVKSLYLTAGVLLLTLTSLNAQLYIKANVGYGVPISKAPIGTNTSMSYDGNGYKTVDTQKSGSFGAGTSASIGLGYMLSKFVGIDLDVRLLSGKKYTLNSSYTDSETASSAYYNSKISAHGLLFAPSIYLTTGNGTKTPYVRLGVVGGSTKVRSEYTSTSNGGGDSNGSHEERTFEYRKGMSLGFTGAIGMNWMLTNNIKLFSEINLTGLNYSPEEMVITKSTTDGVDDLSSMNEFSKHTVYRSTIETSGSTDTTKPRVEEKISMPFSSCSLQAGVVYVFGGVKTE